jgi:hypothetical protein
MFSWIFSHDSLLLCQGTTLKLWFHSNQKSTLTLTSVRIFLFVRKAEIPSGLILFIMDQVTIYLLHKYYHLARICVCPSFFTLVFLAYSWGRVAISIFAITSQCTIHSKISLTAQGTCKVRNEIKTKRNRTKRNEIKRNETKNRSKRNETIILISFKSKIYFHFNFSP